MKTPHRIKLVYEKEAKYDPVLGKYEEEVTTEEVTAPCFLNYVSKAQIMKEYGDYNQRLIICRFSQPVKRFDYAIYDGDRFELEDEKDTLLKGAVRIKRVQI